EQAVRGRVAVAGELTPHDIDEGFVRGPDQSDQVGDQYGAVIGNALVLPVPVPDQAHPQPLARCHLYLPQLAQKTVALGKLSLPRLKEQRGEPHIVPPPVVSLRALDECPRAQPDDLVIDAAQELKDHLVAVREHAHWRASGYGPARGARPRSGTGVGE